MGGVVNKNESDVAFLILDDYSLKTANAGGISAPSLL